jgi:hypothetical protein
MSLQQIRAALDTRLAGYEPALAIAWENTAFNPEDDVPWVQVQLTPVRTTALGLGRAAPVRWTGSYQLVLNFPRNDGPGPAAVLADGIAGHFHRGTALTAANVTVILEQPSIGAGTISAGRYQLGLTIPWFATVG